MRVRYLCRCCNNLNSSVSKKIFFQVEHLNKQLIDSKIYSICTNKYNYEVNGNELIETYYIQEPSGIFGKYLREHRFNTLFQEMIKKLSENDILYLRNTYPSIYLHYILKKPRACKIVIEYQTIEPLEYQLKRKYWYLPIDFLFGNSIRKYTDAIIGVTDEITDYQVSRSGNSNKPHITIGNGYDVASTPIRQSPSFDGKELHLLCVAHIARWHGIDRLLQGIASYQGTIQIVLHIAGDGTERPRLQELTSKLGIEDRVIYHGFIFGQELDTLFDTCHIGVGSLGIHRKGLQQTSELKAREYCSRGIPYITGVSDPDFPVAFPYILKVPPDETLIDIQQVVKFARRVLSDSDHPQNMHRYAERHLDWSVKMKKLKEFLEALV